MFPKRPQELHKILKKLGMGVKLIFDISVKKTIVELQKPLEYPEGQFRGYMQNSLAVMGNF